MDELDNMLDDSAEKRQSRLETCGRYLGRHFRPTDGKYSAHPFFCNIWRDGECPTCFRRRIERLRTRIEEVARSGELWTTRRANHTLSEALADSLPRASYLRLPQRDGSEVFFLSESGNGGAAISLEWVIKSDWTKLVDTPSPRRISGQLGKDHEEDRVEIISPSVILGSVTIKQERKAIAAVLERTGHLKPQTVEELEEALQTRMDVFVEVLEAAGGTILHRADGKYYLTGSIDWKDNTLDSVVDVVGSGYKRFREK